MGILRLQDALKTILIDNGEEILNDVRKTKAYLSDYTGDESRDEIKLLLHLLENNVHQNILNTKEFDAQDQLQFTRQTALTYFQNNYNLGSTIVDLLFSIFYDCGLTRRKTRKNANVNLIEQKMELWKKKLLDLGKRNRLINYHDTKRSSLRLMNPALDEIWNKAVVKGRSLEFPYIDEFDDESGPWNTVNIKRVSPNSITTDQPPKEQQKTLRNLKSKSKSIMEEQGVNVLHLAFGFLNWTEKAETDAILSSPIILVPAFLTQKSITSPFALQIDEDDVVINPTLVYKMEHDFGLFFPDFDMDKDLQQFFAEIENKISALKNWSVERSVVLSLFSFLKINMYKDIESNSEKIKTHPIVKALCGDSSQLLDPLSISPSEYDHDKKHPQDIFQVLDADSSQQDAIVSAKKGLSFVLQGPPGTGKSQTIANIIAESLANNKKVLFVSEKVAALDVVFKRLVNADIGDFCLPLHSHKSNKKEIIGQLGKTLELKEVNKKTTNNLSQIYTRLSHSRKQLNEYCAELHIKRTALQKSVYEIYGELVKVANYKDIAFSIGNIDKISRDDFEKMILALENYSVSLQDNTIEYNANPWFGSSIKIFTYELQHEIEEKLNILIPRLSEIIPLTTEINEKLCLNTGEISNVVRILNDCSGAVKIPYFWLKEEILNKLPNRVDNAEKYFISLSVKLEELNKSLEIIKKSHANFDDFNMLSAKTPMEFNDKLNYFKTFVRNDDTYSIWERIFDFSEIRESFKDLEKNLNTYHSFLNEILLKYDKEILEIDPNALLKRFQLDYSSIFRIFKGRFYKDRRLIISCIKNITKETKKEKIETIIHDLKLLCELKKIHEHFEKKKMEYETSFGVFYGGVNTNAVKLGKKIENFENIIISAGIFTEVYQLFSQYDELNNEFAGIFSFYYNGFETDWNKVKNALSWTGQLYLLKKDIPINETFVKRLCDDVSMPVLCLQYYNALVEKLAGMLDLMQWFYKLFDKDALISLDIWSVLKRMKDCKKNIDMLYDWIDYSNAKSKCLSLGLEPYITKIESEEIQKNNIVSIFKKHFYKTWVDHAMTQSVVLQNFRGQYHEKIISDFKDFDREQFLLARGRIREILIEKLSYQNIFMQGGNEIKILKHELNKKKRIMPLRKLFQKIPNLLLTLKPCLMMSPLTVSLFLESNQFYFDTIIFDEASQVCTENAIGAISRGKQVILAGDSKQLPPTTFFTATISDPEYDEEDKDDYTDMDSFESVLDEAESSFPSRTLQWHYRSKHEHLIAFSNSKIYNNKLITFPSNIEKNKENGVEYIYVENGIYDRGGKKDNIEEAKKVVEIIFESLRLNPSRSLGVITFSVSQRETIETVLRKERLKNPAYDDYFNEDKDEPFFIKNIETVQGDERDTIVFSIGYGRDIAGRMSMFFGPLSSTGGERRLNVAITRAKHNVKLVGSILPADIKTEKITSEGPKLLHAYIDFAINGPKVLNNEKITNENNQVESPFEQSVFDFLVQEGYKVSTQIGCSGYRIDMGIHNPQDYSSYCLGIECDGVTYHSARTARERDRLRQTVLEDMEWKIYRIWSTDWIRNTKNEKHRLLEAVNNSIPLIT
jgi:very-short-patch-repair endonuclease